MNYPLCHKFISPLKTSWLVAFQLLLYFWSVADCAGAERPLELSSVGKKVEDGSGVVTLHPNGQVVVVSKGGKLRGHSPPMWKEEPTWYFNLSGKPSVNVMTASFSRDGLTLYVGDDGGGLRSLIGGLSTSDSAKETFYVKAANASVMQCVVSPNGKYILAQTHESVNVHLAKTGKMVAESRVSEPNAQIAWFPDSDHFVASSAESVRVFSSTGKQVMERKPDGLSALAVSPCENIIAYAETGRKMITILKPFAKVGDVEIKEPGGDVTGLAFLEGGRLLSLFSETQPLFDRKRPSQEAEIHLWRVTDGRSLGHRPIPADPRERDPIEYNWQRAPKLVSSGQTNFFAIINTWGLCSIWEGLSCQTFGEIRNGVLTEWSKDGRRFLASDSSRSTYVCDLEKLFCHRKLGARIGIADQIDQLWMELGDSPAVALVAGELFVREGAIAVKQILKHALLARPPERTTIDAWVEQLSDRVYHEREYAERQLAKHVGAYSFHYATVLETDGTPERQLRLNRILSTCPEGLSVAELRVARCVKLLERIGTKEALEAIQVLRDCQPESSQIRVSASEAISRLRHCR